ncbi:MAG: hypothetical protein Q7R39_09475 [Dehalococcoidia bacterium]|nr:hypothetical protein [Dehalococcoidia bacterium]
MTGAGLDPHLLEQHLSQIRGVISAQVVASADGEIGEVHILAASQRPPKQLVRDIESLVLLHFKKKIDYRKISIVQLEGRRVTALNRIQLKGVQCQPDATPPQWAVTLQYEQRELLGEWQGDTSVSEAEGAAEATLRALKDLVGPALQLALKEAKLTQMDGGGVVVAAVAVGVPPRQETLLGCSFVKESVAEAAARSVLGAINRRLPFTAE